MQFPDISSLPPWAQMTVIVAFGVSVAIILLVTRMGLLQGRQAAPAHSAASAQVAAVIVDPTALNRLTDQVVALNAVLDEIVKAGREKIRVDGLMAAELDRIREELRIQRELSRRN